MEKLSTGTAINRLEKNSFGVGEYCIYGYGANGTNGTGAAIDYLVNEHGYSYLPNTRKPRN